MTWCQRRYTWLYVPDDPREAEYAGTQAARQLVSFADLWPRYFRDPEVTGHALGVTEFSITVCSRDQWWVAKRSRRLLAAIEEFTEIPLHLVSEVDVQGLPVHDHRSNAWLAENSTKPAYTQCKAGHWRPRGVKCRACATSPRKKVSTPWPVQPR
jgi:hypothetical protein